jgi:hypothetical protein
MSASVTTPLFVPPWSNFSAGPARWCNPRSLTAARCASRRIRPLDLVQPSTIRRAKDKRPQDSSRALGLVSGSRDRSGHDPRRQNTTACRESSMVYEAADGTEPPLPVFEPAEDTRLAAGIVLFHGGALRTGRFIASITTQDRRPGSTDRRRPARTGLDPSETADHFRNTSGPQWTDKQRRLIYVSAAQPPLDLARPKGLEPLTF